MARKTTHFHGTFGRDKDKVYLLTEKSAEATEDWANRVLVALLNGGATIPEGIESAGLAGVLAVGISGLEKLSYPTVKPLLDEMLDCVMIIPDPKKQDIVRHRVEDDFEEVLTLYAIRKAIFELHAGFFLTAVLPKFAGSAAGKSGG